VPRCAVTRVNLAGPCAALRSDRCQPRRSACRGAQWAASASGIRAPHWAVTGIERAPVTEGRLGR
jgi:hypothetical protein